MENQHILFIFLQLISLYLFQIPDPKRKPLSILLDFCKLLTTVLGVMAHTFNYSTREADAGRSL